MAIVGRAWVDWSQQYSRGDPSRQHVQIAVHALTPNLRFALLVRNDGVRQRIVIALEELITPGSEVPSM